VLRERGYLAIRDQIVDATIIEARRPPLMEAETETKAWAGYRRSASRSVALRSTATVVRGGHE
jgi:hypothetical protein